jgi:hypothetical protein
MKSISFFLIDWLVSYQLAKKSTFISKNVKKHIDV